MRGPEAISVDMSQQAKGIKTTNDTTVTVLKLQDLGIKPKEKEPSFQPSSTSLHEAGHTLVGVMRNVGIDGTNIIPKGDALGTTHPDQFDAPTAAAGYATGTGGHGYDQFVTEVIHGKSFGEAALVASVILINNQEALMDLGRALDTKKSLSRREIYSIVNNAGKEDEEDNKPNKTMYEVTVKGKNGEERDVVVLPEDQKIINVSLPQSGDIFVAGENKKELSLAR